MMPSDSSDGRKGPELPPPLVTVEVDDDESVSTNILSGVSAVSDHPTTDLPLLNDAIDVDALDVLFAHSPNEARLLFRYAGYLVAVKQEAVKVHQPASD